MQFLRPANCLVVFALLCCLQLAGCADSVETQSTVAAAPSLEEVKTAILQGDLQGVESSLGEIDINALLADGSTLLAWAVESQYLPMVELLLKKGAKTDPESADPKSESSKDLESKSSEGLETVEANLFRPLILACIYGDSAIIQTLLNAGAQVNVTTYDGITPLQICAADASTEVVKALLDAGAAPDAANLMDQTPLMWAASKGHLATMELLLEHGADINKATASGFNPLFFAIKSGSLEAAHLAADAGADLNHRSVDGTSAAQLAMYQKNYPAAHWIISQGANLDDFDREGYQLLHAATLANQVDIAKLLIESGADPLVSSELTSIDWRYEVNFKTEDYIPPLQTALEMAQENGFDELVALYTNQEYRPDSLLVSEAQSEEIEVPQLTAEPIEPADQSLALGFDPKVLIQSRIEGFKDIGATMRQIRTQVESGDFNPESLKEQTKRLAASAKLIDSWFPEGSGSESGVFTDALDYIWQNPEKFTELKQELVERTTDFEHFAAQEEWASMESNLEPLLDTCANCHGSFRAY